MNAIERYEESNNGMQESKNDINNNNSLLAAGDVLSGRTNKGIHTLGTPFDQASANALPHTIESFVERSLFDAICAFSSGRRQQPTTYRKTSSNEGFKMSKGGLNVKKAVYVVQKKARDNGKVEIALTNVVTAKGKETEEAAANELLVGTQMNAFLNFCQSRPSDKVTSLWAEKVCALLNFLYSYVSDMTDQLGSARLDLSQVTSRIGVMDQRLQNLRLKYSLERTAKQKSALKYVREQMRLSDLRILLQDLNQNSDDAQYVFYNCSGSFRHVLHAR